VSRIATSRPFTIAGLDHVNVIVNGMEDAIRFYEGVLGCSVEARLPEYGMASLRAGTNEIDLVDISVKQGAWAKPAVLGGANVDHFALAIHALDETALREFLAAHDIRIVEERAEDDDNGGSLSLYVLDPSGNKVELLLRRGGVSAR